MTLKFIGKLLVRQESARTASAQDQKLPLSVTRRFLDFVNRPRLDR